jgi:hypothetical protein
MPGTAVADRNVMDDFAATARRNSMDDRSILFPLMLIAAIAVIALSAVGMVTMLGWMPDALSSTKPVSRAAAAEVAPRPVREAVTPCVDCALGGGPQGSAADAETRG